MRQVAARCGGILIEPDLKILGGIPGRGREFESKALTGADFCTSYAPPGAYDSGAPPH